MDSRLRLHGCGLYAGITDVGTGSCGRALTVQSRRYGYDGGGRPRGTPLRGEGLRAAREGRGYAV